ncbi:sensor histidine kinase [Paraglaciecola psychrophila]|uniref:histidine kinase n=1 Tax=Paraglaciecola psychrophila 170 TaxID=1129794 RepID=K6YXY5_9ALTE|nr:ATP-binding protein [Paraglaciecola psychrophila]AGH45780.1 histidine kinase [Paraglaciecola psychrophila 170]GAC37594.1 two-component system, sensor histidine kinase FlrB [Paraglaciecola psychrophila 170]
MGTSNILIETPRDTLSALGEVIRHEALQNASHVSNTKELDALRLQANRLEHLLQVMPAGVVVIDGKGVVRQSNNLAKTLLGEPLEGQLWRTIIARSFKPQADDGHEVSLYDGRKVKLSITPLEKEPGQLIVLTDLTETRQLQQRIGHLQKLSSLGKMVASLAHQIRTPLSAAMLYAANLSNNTLNKTSREKFSSKLVSRLRDLESQVNDMLLFAKSGDQQVISEISLQSLMQEVQQGADAMLQSQQANLVLSLPEPDVIILGNKTALVGALQNLIHNALTVKPKNALITVAASRQCGNPDWVDLSVTDNGPGIKNENLSRIFEPFYTTKSNGTGLGLAVVRSVAQSHQGKVQVTNLVEGGACFTLSLPTYDVSQSPQQTIALTKQANALTKQGVVPTRSVHSQQYFADAAGS